MAFLQRFSIIIITVIAIGFAAIVFAYKLATRSNLEEGTTDYSNLLQNEVSIYRNQFGIPHIVASTEQDVYFSLGYAHAQDRLWQMDFLRRVGRGQLSEVMGIETIEADRFFRVVGIGRIADNLVRSLSKQSIQALESYTRGVNCYITNQSNKYPFEFDALHYKPQPWKVSDCLVIERLMAFDMSMSFWTDIAIGEIADSLGVDEAIKFIPEYPQNAPTVIDSYQPQQNTDSVSTSIIRIAEKPSKEKLALLKEFGKVMGNVREAIGFRGMQSGSNCWVMKKNSGKQSEVILANDPHLTLGLPARWYQVHLTCPQLNVIGNSIPGTPGIVSGRNDFIAWGITNMMVDDCDYFFERVDPENKVFYFNGDGARVRFKMNRDTIKVKNADDVVFDYRSTPRSAVISDAHIVNTNEAVLQYPSTNNSIAKKYALTFSWTAREKSDETLGILRIMKARTWNEFTNGTNIWNTPALNFTYADRNGNMGVAPSGYTPIRGEGNPNFPHPGWDDKYSWKGVRSATALPRSYNPSRGFVSSANNLTARSLPFFVTSLWEPSSRAERIEEVLKQYNDYNYRDAQFMQNDIVSPNAKFVLQRVLPILLKDTTWFTPTENNALRKLASWDYVMSSQDATPAIYTTFHERFMYKVFTTKLSEGLYKKYAFVGSLPYRKLNEIITDTTYAWFSPLDYKGKDIYERIVRQSFKDGVRIMADRYGIDINLWKYGELHPLILKHPFSGNPNMRSVVTQTLKTIGGDATTINNALWRVHDPYEVAVGASMRFIADMQDTIVYTVLPGGSSGQPLDAHYYDQLQLWSNGGYIPMSSSRNVNKSFTLYTTLLPKKD